MSIVYTKTKWTDVQRVMSNVMEVVDGEDSSTVVMACLALAVSSQVANPTLAQIKEGIKGASEWIALYAASLDPTAEKMVAN